MNRYISVALIFLFPLLLRGQEGFVSKEYVKSHYSKREVMIPMRDGVRLFTAIYVPKSGGATYPMLMMRTPYSCSPYGSDQYTGWLGPNGQLAREGNIFVYQDVRGRYRSEGQFEEMTPAIDAKKGNQTDESSDTYDTIEWLLKHITGNNGRVGVYGISYPGFYASACLPGAHPAIRAVSPQAPVTDEFIGDDAYHNGAFFLEDNFEFTNYFQGERIDSGKDYRNLFTTHFDDAYAYFLSLGPLKNANGPELFNHRAKIWDEYLAHDRYDEYWQARNIRTHLKNIRPAVLVVGGWFDAEDMFGALATYRAIEDQNPQNRNQLFMGPWTHGAWASPTWDHFGSYRFGSNVNEYFNQVLTAFFNFYLKDQGSMNLPEATVFETGSNQWKTYPTWPPAQARREWFYLREKQGLNQAPPGDKAGFDELVSDPAHPVPYTAGKYNSRNNEYLVEDQRFAASRPDVLVFESEPLEKDLLLTGPIKAKLFVSTTGTDMDVVVKLIDVLPADKSPAPAAGNARDGGGLQRLVRAEVFRGKFRNSYEKPEPFRPEEISTIRFDLNAVAHKFLRGHRIMVQVQCSWFPLVDRNPQVFMSIPQAGEKDFTRARIRVYHDKDHASGIEIPVMP